MAAVTDVWNMALASIGSKKQISSATLGTSTTRDIVKLFSTRALNEMKRRHQWQAFSVYEKLALVKECPNDMYNFAYQYPKDCLFFRKILSGVRNDNETTRVPFARGRIRGDDNKLVSVIFTDHAEPVGLYTEKDSEDTDFDDDFAIAWSFRLGYFIAPSLTGGDPFKKQQSALANFQTELHNAIKMDLSEQQRDPYPESKYVRARNRHRSTRIDGEPGLIVPSGQVIN